ncbi:MAG: hypothetical protein IJ184_02725 [Alphaproteobacteria bacterium]|nr:hypothetical protein [Alphaproteobacteria bacterium]
MMQDIAIKAKIGLNHLEGKSLREIMDEVILPKIVRPSGSRRHGNCIDDDFMYGMYEHGAEIFVQDAYCYEVLAEIAMQRLLQGAVEHFPVPLETALSEQYRIYSTADDTLTPMTNACWLFIKSNIRLCLQSGEELAHQARAVLMGIVEHINDQGLPKGWTGAPLALEDSLLVVRRFCFDMLERYCAFYEVFYLINADNWQCYKQYLAHNDVYGLLDWTAFFRKLRLDGFWQFARRRQIKKAISAAL